MRTMILYFGGTVAPASALVERYAFPLGKLWQISSLEVVFQVGQAGTLFVRPRAERVCGTIDDLLLPQPEVTGDDWSFHIESIPMIFVPGAALRFDIRNTDTLHTRRYTMVVELREAVAEELSL